MSISLAYGLGFVLYCLICVISYTKMPFPYLLGGIFGFLSNVLWVYVAKHSGPPSQILKNGIIWDGMITAIYFFLPFLVFNARISTVKGLIGIAMILGGIGVLKH